LDASDDIRVPGAASYATPLLSTAFLMLAGFARPSVAIAIAAVLIARGRGYDCNKKDAVIPGMNAICVHP
jgi:hypothetical protein